MLKLYLFLKKDDETQFTNYRPISLLSTISKIFGRIIFKYLYKFILNKILLYDSQYGFKEGHWTEYAILELVNRITLEMDNMNPQLVHLLDLSKAFDTLTTKYVLKAWILWIKLFVNQTYGKLFIK